MFEESLTPRPELENNQDPKPTSPRTVNQSWLKQLTASFNDLVGAGKEDAADRGRNAATYAVSEIPRLRAAPIMPASAIIISTPTNPPSAKAIAPPATPPLPPRKVQALTTPEP